MCAKRSRIKGIKKHRTIGHRPKHNKKSVDRRKEIKKYEARIARKALQEVSKNL